jgi:hypothetical protein
MLAASLFALVAAVATTVAATNSNSNDDMSLLVKNVETLAYGENDPKCTGPKAGIRLHCKCEKNEGPCMDNHGCKW